MFRGPNTARYWLGDVDQGLDDLSPSMSSDAIKQVIIGPLEMDRLDIGSPMS